MLRYFGDEYQYACGKCSNCMTKFEAVDVTVEAQKILSCIIKTGQYYGVKMITDVLCGVSSDKIIRAGLDKQSTFGIMKDNSAAEIKYIIEKLEEQEYNIFVDAKRPTLRVTEMSYLVLRGRAKVWIKKSKLIKAYEEKPVLSDMNSDATLTDMCRKMPTTNSEFLMVSGVGQNKLDKYGEAFMQVIEKYKPDKKRQTAVYDYPRAAGWVSMLGRTYLSFSHNL